MQDNNNEENNNNSDLYISTSKVDKPPIKNNKKSKSKKGKDKNTEIEPSKVNFEDLISIINQIMSKGQGVEMKNKQIFLETLSSARNTLSTNKNLFETLRYEPNMIKLFNELENTIYDVQSKLDKLSLISFCRDKAEKYLSRVTEKLQNINMILLAYLAGTKNKAEIPIPVPEHDNKYEEEMNDLINQIQKMNEEIDLLKKKKPEPIPEKKIDLTSDAQKLYLGIKNLYGINGRINYKLAYDYFNEVMESDNDNTEAILLLALMYENGYYVDRSYSKAFELLQNASDKGNPQATFKLGQYAENKFYNINIIEINEKFKEENDPNKLALKFYKESAEKGYSDAFAKLGYIFENGTLGISQDVNKAYDYYDTAVKMDENPTGLNGIGNFYYEQQDYSIAVEKYKKAAQGGCPNAINNLGMCFEYGRGLSQNLHKALQCYKTASDLNLPVALANQGILKIKMSIDQYADIDYKECFKLLEFSTKLDDKMKEAYYYLGLLNEIGFKLFDDQEKFHNPLLAFMYYNKAAELGHTKAKLKVGIAYYNGIENVFASNEEHGKKLIFEAAEEGDEEAKFYLQKITSFAS